MSERSRPGDAAVTFPTAPGRMVVGVAIVQRQSEKWPYHDRKRRFTTKTSVNRMRSMLLNRTFGFMSEGTLANTVHRKWKVSVPGSCIIRGTY